MNRFAKATFLPIFLLVTFFLVTGAHAEGIIRVACVGDSITYGFSVPQRETNSYPARLGASLGAGYEVRNFGVNGATLLHQGDRPYFKQADYAQALDFKPDLLVIDLGANDSKHPIEGSLTAGHAVNNWQYYTNYVRDYEDMIAAFHQVNPSVKVFVCFPTPDYPGRWGINDQTIREEMIPLIRTVAQDTGATIIDLYAALSGKPELFPDTVHPNAVGAGLIAAAVYRGLTGQGSSEIPEAAALLMNRRVLWLGDSITQDGRYVSDVLYYLEKKYPTQKFDLISLGLASETVSGLSEKAHPFPRPCVFERLQRALDAVKPATVVACYGMNDGIYHPLDPDRMQAFEEGIHRLSSAAHAAGAQFILLTPPPFDPVPVKNVQPAAAPDFSFIRPYNNYDSVLATYSDWEKTLPTTEARVVIDLHTVMANALAQHRQTNSLFSFTKDGIHPGPVGHLIMAQAVLRGLGVPVDDTDPDAELVKLETDPLFQLVGHQRGQRSAGWLAYVGYTRDHTVKSPSVNATEQAVAALQVKIDALRH